MKHVSKVCSQNGTRVVSVLHPFLACDPLKQCDICQSHSSECKTVNAVNTAEVMIIFISPRHTSGNNDLKISLFLLSDQTLDSPWVRRFPEFLADLEVPADPEGRLLLSLRGNHALPVRRHGDNQHGARQSVSQKNRAFYSGLSTYSGSSSTSSSSLSRNTLKGEDRENSSAPDMLRWKLGWFTKI